MLSRRGTVNPLCQSFGPPLSLFWRERAGRTAGLELFLWVRGEGLRSFCLTADTPPLLKMPCRDS